MRLRVNIIVISMKSAVERRALAVEQLGNARLEFRFFDAIEGVGCIPRHFDCIDERLYRLNTLREPLAGEIGCYASHLALWKACVALNEPILILEDDFQLADGFADALPVVENFARSHGFVRIQSFARKRKRLKNLLQSAFHVQSYEDFRLFYLSDVPLCMLAYAIFPSAARSLIEASTSLIAPVDKFLQQTWVHNTPIYALSPALVQESRHAAASTIGTRQKKSRSPWLRLRRAVYKCLGELNRARFDQRQGLRHLTAEPAKNQEFNIVPRKPT